MAMRLQYELYRLSQFRPLAQQYVTDDKDEETSEQLFCEAKEVGKKSWDDTSSMSSGMEWFLPSDSESEFGDDDAVSLHSSCESENRDDEDDEGNDTGKLLPEQANGMLREHPMNSSNTTAYTIIQQHAILRNCHQRFAVSSTNTASLRKKTGLSYACGPLSPERIWTSRPRARKSPRKNNCPLSPPICRIIP